MGEIDSAATDNPKPWCSYDQMSEEDCSHTSLHVADREGQARCAELEARLATTEVDVHRLQARAARLREAMEKVFFLPGPGPFTLISSAWIQEMRAALAGGEEGT